MSVKMSALDGKLYQDTPLGEWFLGKSGVVNQSLIFRKGRPDRSRAHKIWKPTTEA